MVRPGLINLDFADVRAVMDEMGKAMMGTGEADGEDRAIQAAEKAIANPLLDEISLRGARGVLINITGGADLTLFELDEAANRIREEVDVDANIIVGSTMDDTMQGGMRVSVVATGIDATEVHSDIPIPNRDAVTNTQTEEEPIYMAEPEVETLEAAEEPDLFHSEAVASEDYASDEPTFADRYGYQEAPQGHVSPSYEPQADVPPPAYQEPEEHQDHFVAPKAPSLGMASDQGMSRMRSAVSSAQEAERPASQAESAPAEKPRFGIGSLINRMSGSESDRGRSMARRAPEPQVNTRLESDADEKAADPEQERIEVPAFLRRQAN